MTEVWAGKWTYIFPCLSWLWRRGEKISQAQFAVDDSGIPLVPSCFALHTPRCRFCRECGHAEWWSWREFSTSTFENLTIKLKVRDKVLVKWKFNYFWMLVLQGIPVSIIEVSWRGIIYNLIHSRWPKGMTSKPIILGIAYPLSPWMLPYHDDLWRTMMNLSSDG